MTVERIATATAPSPSGHYAQATAAGGLVFVSGQLPVDGHGELVAVASFEVQARQALANVLAIAAAAGAAPENLVRVSAYIVGVENWPTLDAVFAEMLPKARPARTVVPVHGLHHGVLVEIDAIALAAAG